MELEDSPFLVEVIERRCTNGFKATAVGTCECPRNYFISEGRCRYIFNPGVIIAIIVGGLIAIALLVWLFL